MNKKNLSSRSDIERSRSLYFGLQSLERACMLFKYCSKPKKKKCDAIRSLKLLVQNKSILNICKISISH